MSVYLTLVVAVTFLAAGDRRSGVTRVLGMLQEQEYALKAEEAWQKVVDIYEDCDGWKIDRGSSLDEGIVSSKHYSGIGKMYKLEVRHHSGIGKMYKLEVRYHSGIGKMHDLFFVF